MSEQQIKNKDIQLFKNFWTKEQEIKIGIVKTKTKSGWKPLYCRMVQNNLTDFPEPSWNGFGNPNSNVSYASTAQ